MTTRTEFKPGDRVRRTRNPRSDAPLGFETGIIERNGRLWAASADDTGTYVFRPDNWELVPPAAPFGTLITFEGEPIRDMTRERLLEVIEVLGREAYPDIFKEAA